MEDVTPKLLEAIENDFKREVANSDLLINIRKKIKEGTATYAEANDYAIEVGRALSKSYLSNLSSAVLPDGKMYYNIGQRILSQTMGEDFELVKNATMDIQKVLNDAADIGLKPQAPELNSDRIKGMVDRLSSEDTFDDVKWLLDEPVVNFSQSVVDDTIKKNADFHAKSGLTPKIERKLAGGCCKWCARLAGTYTYPDVPDDIYRRHQRCRCTVNYDPGKGKVQNVWSKAWTKQENDAKIEERKNINPNVKRSFAQRGMANGPRRGRLTNVNEEEEKHIRQVADEISVPQEVLSFNTGSTTSFDELAGKINIRGDIFPADYAVNPESILDEKCALAHEYYGHMKHHPSNFDPGDWRDEFRASYRAAIDTPNLDDAERRLLMIDAYERASNAGVSVTYNDMARRMIYGI